MQATPESFRAQVEAARDHLKACMQNRDAAAHALTEAQAAVDRVRSLISAADSADAELKTAEESSANFTRRWAENGADKNAPPTDPKLRAAADAASRKTIAARISADGAAAGLPAVQTALDDAQSALHRADESIGAACNAVMVAAMEEHFMLAAYLAAAFDEQAIEIQAFVKAISGNWYPFSDEGAAVQLLNRLQAAMPASPYRDTQHLRERGKELEARSREFVALGSALMVDADAE